MSRNVPFLVECEHCGYSWSYRGSRADGSTCPECDRVTKFGRDLSESPEWDRTSTKYYFKKE